MAARALNVEPVYKHIELVILIIYDIKKIRAHFAQKFGEFFAAFRIIAGGHGVYEHSDHLLRLERGAADERSADDDIFLLGVSGQKHIECRKHDRVKRVSGGKREAAQAGRNFGIGRKTVMVAGYVGFGRPREIGRHVQRRQFTRKHFEPDLFLLGGRARGDEFFLPQAEIFVLRREFRKRSA
ncbi:MAG: hypothetical protein ACD_59C00007G0001 [uncultured bacterium]|nr:MAG: hypothetical protein ACD_59C00007G0001 [uncultured bacterium]